MNDLVNDSDEGDDESSDDDSDSDNKDIKDQPDLLLLVEKNEKLNEAIPDEVI